MRVKTRFAPSPTGALHIGTARTAYFNWLYARKNLGHFEIRIEDTDKERNQNPTALLEIIEWLGFDHDRLSYQSANIDRHKQIAIQLEQTGAAYYAEGAIRFKVPKDQALLLQDHVQGSVSKQSKDLEDFVLLRSDGTPTYILASMVDDFYDEITHVIRGVDHLTNTFKQLLLYQALKRQPPQFTHIPLITDLDRQKLSKRHGALSVQELREDGYLQEGICNTLLRLGWSYGNEEIVPKSKALEIFDLKDLNKSPACFDPDKLKDLNAYYMRSDEQLWAKTAEWRVGWSEAECERAQLLLHETAKRTVTLKELVEALNYCRDDFRADYQINLPGLDKVLNDCEFTEEQLNVELRKFASEKGLNFGKDIAKPLRVVLTGKETSPSLFYVMEGLGKEVCLERVRAATLS